jgi:hypothetical protein
MSIALVPLRFRALCNGISSGDVIQYVEPGGGYYRVHLPSSGHGVFTNAAYTFNLLLNRVQWIEDEHSGRVLHAQTMLYDGNGMVVGHAPWYAWADNTWPPNASPSMKTTPR